MAQPASQRIQIKTRFRGIQINVAERRRAVSLPVEYVAGWGLGRHRAFGTLLTICQGLAIQRVLEQGGIRGS